MALTQISTQGIKDGTITGSDLATNIDLVDNQKIRLGTGNDLQIYHDGSHSRIDEVGTGNLMIQSNNAVFIKKGTSEEIAKFNVDGAVELYHNNIKTFETTGEGVTFDTGSSSCVVRLTSNTDAITVLQGFNSDFLLKAPSGGSVSILTNANESSINCITNGAVELYHDNVLKLTTLSAGVQMANGSGNNTFSIFDSDKLSFGNNGDLKIFHDGNNSIITAGGAGDLQLISTFDDIEIKAADNIFIRPQGGEEGIKVIGDGAVELYHDNSKKFETTSSGATLTGNLDLSGDNSISIGTGNDLLIQCDGQNSAIVHAGDGDLVLLAQGSGEDIRFQANENIDLQTNNNETAIHCDKDGAVELYHDNVKMLDTSSNGVNFRGEIRSATTSSILSNCTLKNESTSADGVDYFQCRTDNNTLRLVIEPDGDVKNQNNSYGQTSDSKLKENIVDANSQWNDIKAIKVRNFNFKESTGFSTHTQIGVVAQELEITSPHLVYESIDRDPNTGKDLETKTKNVRYSVMYMKAIKCLQEAMAKIEVLETEVAALKAG